MSKIPYGYLMEDGKLRYTPLPTGTRPGPFLFDEFPKHVKKDILINQLLCTSHDGDFYDGRELSMFAFVRAMDLELKAGCDFVSGNWFHIMCQWITDGNVYPGVGDYFDKPCQQWPNKEGLPVDG